MHKIRLSQSTPFEDAMDGADPDFEIIQTDSNTCDNGNTPHTPPITTTFNPLKYNLPTRLHNPCTSTTPNTTSTSSVFLINNPTALQIRIFLDDIEQAAKDYIMSGEETIGMAIYYADRDSKLLWKWMVESAKGQDWSRFKNHVLWFYPDATILEQEEVQRVFRRIQQHLPPHISANDNAASFPFAYGVSSRGARSHLVGCLRILEDLSTKIACSNRQLCIAFAAGLPESNSDGRPGSASWKENLGRRLRERYPELKDEFDCNPRRFLYYVFLVWRDAWVVGENNYFKQSSF